MATFNIKNHSHRRLNILTGEWVLCSPHRAKRPWQGQVEKPEQADLPRYDPKCYLCPENERVGGGKNPKYESTCVFNNDFGALTEDIPWGKEVEGDFFVAEAEQGICRVICFSPRHDLTIPEMEVQDIRKVIDLWVDEYKALGAKPFINHVQIFENKGSVMGCSNPHPHGQIWSQKTIPTEPAKKQVQQKAYWDKNASSLLGDYLNKELDKKIRILSENEHFVALVPFWAAWPFEAMIAPKRHIQNILQFTSAERTDFADIYKKLTVTYDNLFETSFPYSAGIHQSPTDGREYPEWHLHMNFYPPLLRSAAVKKFMVGYEMFASPQRDITPEDSAERLISLDTVHYKNR